MVRYQSNMIPRNFQRPLSIEHELLFFICVQHRMNDEMSFRRCRHDLRRARNAPALARILSFRLDVSPRAERIVRLDAVNALPPASSFEVMVRMPAHAFIFNPPHGRDASMNVMADRPADE